jgi:hypothetical protein
MLEVISLTAQDRCDGCGAQAFSIAVRGGTTLLFCKHHRRKSTEKLEAEGWSIIDDISTGNWVETEKISV